MKTARRFCVYAVLLFTCINQVAAQGKHPVSKTKSRILVIAGQPVTAADSVRITDLFYEALKQKSIENYTLAAENFNTIIGIDPQNDAALFELGKIRNDVENNSSSARDLFERAVTLKPQNKDYWVALADIYAKTNDVARLEYAYTELLKLDPENEEYLFGKANTLYVEKKYDEALAVYKQLEDLDGLNDNIVANRQKIYLKQGKLDQAIAEMEHLIDQSPGQIRYYLLLSELYNSNNMNDKALEVLKRAEKVDNRNAMVHLALADIYKDQNEVDKSFEQIKIAFANPQLDIDEKIRIILGYFPKFPDKDAIGSASALCKILVEAHPADAKAYAIYGNVLMQNGEYKTAKPLFKKAVTLNKQLYDVWEQLVRIELSDGETDAALADGQEALSYFPNQAWLNYLMGVLWYQKKEYKKAITFAGNATALATDDKSLLSQCYAIEGDAYHDLNDNEHSDGAYDQALKYDPHNAYTLNNYAYYLSLRNQDLDKAATMSLHAIDRQPNTSSFEDTYAWILFKQKKYSEARIWIDKSIAHDKTDNGTQLEHCGDITFFLGDTNTALEYWKKAKKAGAASPLLDRKINEKKYVE